MTNKMKEDIKGFIDSLYHLKRLKSQDLMYLLQANAYSKTLIEIAIQEAYANGFQAAIDDIVNFIR